MNTSFILADLVLLMSMWIGLWSFEAFANSVSVVCEMGVSVSGGSSVLISIWLIVLVMLLFLGGE